MKLIALAILLTALAGNAALGQTKNAPSKLALAAKLADRVSSFFPKDVQVVLEAVATEGKHMTFFIRTDERTWFSVSCTSLDNDAGLLCLKPESIGAAFILK
jgi:hypothetical protein